MTSSRRVATSAPRAAARPAIVAALAVGVVAGFAAEASAGTVTLGDFVVQYANEGATHNPPYSSQWGEPQGPEADVYGADPGVWIHDTVTVVNSTVRIGSVYHIDSRFRLRAEAWVDAGADPWAEAEAIAGAYAFFARFDVVGGSYLYNGPHGLWDGAVWFDGNFISSGTVIGPGSYWSDCDGGGGDEFAVGTGMVGPGHHVIRQAQQNFSFTFKDVNQNIVPLPASSWMGLSLLAGIGGVTWLRRRGRPAIV